MSDACPNCKGAGEITGYSCPGFSLMEIKCDICKGSGVLPQGIIYDPVRGKDLKLSRLEPEYKNIRDKSKELGVSVAQLSQMERGYFSI